MYPQIFIIIGELIQKKNWKYVHDDRSAEQFLSMICISLTNSKETSAYRFSATPLKQNQVLYRSIESFCLFFKISKYLPPSEVEFFL